MKSLGKRLALTVGAVGTVAALVGAVSFALFTSQAKGQTDTFAAGTVVLGSAATGSCNVQNMEPGDSSSGYTAGNKADPSCTYSITYSGSLNAWVGLQIGVQSTGIATYTPTGSSTPIGGAALLNSTGKNQLQYQVSLNNGVTSKTLSTSQLPVLSCKTTSGIPTCSGQTGYILFPGTVMSATKSNSAPTGSWQNKETGTVVVEYGLPLSAGNKYQGSSATITLSARAVQASNNPLGDNNQPSAGWYQDGTTPPSP